MKIGLISDTHSFWDETIPQYFKECDEIWHAGDIGESGQIMEQLNKIAPSIAVYGNIDTPEFQRTYPENLFIEREGVKIFMTHIGGKPPSYNPRVRKLIQSEKPDVFICGHSHILRAMPDKKHNNLLYLNPGAAGNQGFHKIRTMMRFEINNGKIEKLEVIELGKRGGI
ncbi:metallophosphoesterase family protein [Marivirga harenae]|uniref:metallophosphoesterase family protein n=1 Tax=Marivirga harenae TaxID=2010992 RepID=UPI0026DFF581|nr:metallophosphoesterase family protein [Marivirga harenae]WKV11738.1 metallophosphoesterase family protein [Marivirga harenae]